MEPADKDRQIKVALLTSGNGPIIFCSWQFLSHHADLRVVVYSEKRKRKSLLITMWQYGLWYSAQMFIKKLAYGVFRWKVKKMQLSRQGVKIMHWHSKETEAEIISQLKSLEIELIITCGFGNILSQDFIDTFDFCINIHPSLLPDLRGPEPIIWGLLLKRREHGITAHLLDAGIDTGDIIDQNRVSQSALPLHVIIEFKLAQQVDSLMAAVIKFVKQGGKNKVAQTGGIYYPLPTKKNRKKF